MPPVEEMRAAIKEAYSSKRWWAKVAKMSDAQVYAIWQKFKNQKKI